MYKTYNFVSIKDAFKCLNKNLIILLPSDAEGHIAISLPYLGMIQVCAPFRYIDRDEDPVLAKKPDPGLCTSNEGRVLKVY